jgi:hypothetical protein
MITAPIVDMLAVTRALKGERIRLYPEEKRWAIHEAARRGLKDGAIAYRLNTSTEHVRAVLSQPAPSDFDVSDPNAFVPLPEDCEVAA